MRKFRLYDLITGWTVFVVAAVVYLMTIEPTASFWDCGEFIATAYKLEVGHPPGAPFFMILGKFFTLFAGGNKLLIPKTMNVLSALASGFTILFLFWTIVHLARKFYGFREEYKLSQIITILGAGAVGALAYTFSDTFWFSAVEAEVYATSSLFTAFVFWAMLKWENISDQPHANRWIILIAYLMGVSIGIHLLNLLTIPALVFIFYFSKHKVSTRGFLLSIIASLVLLLVMLYVIIPGIPFFASRFELLFVNGMHLPYFSGVAFYMFLLFGLIIFGIYYTRKRQNSFWNTILISLFVIVMGYSSYAVIVIRSAANTPLDESNPETIFALQRYLNREQYGDRPLMYGAYFNARPEALESGKVTYYKSDDGGYEKSIIDRKYKYNSHFEGFFPRMWSSQSKHADEYIYWGKLRESDLYKVRTDANGQPVQGRMGGVQFDHSSPKDPPTFAQNLRFFFRYQVGYMYLRYFMWNFAGRQNDLQGSGELTRGNWISGIKFIDEARLGPQENLPPFIKNNRGHNRYFMLPLLLGLIGMVFHFRRKFDDAWVVALLFIMTGFAIVVYLNQYPLQPRERDYAYAASFYAFTVWVGLGVVALVEAIKKKIGGGLLIPALVVLLSLVLVPGIMARENWDDHDRSHRYLAEAFAKNYLNSCDKNAIIFTNGDNDTFPLWYVQEVEGYRTDVRVVNLSYLTADWYIEQMTYQFYDSDPLPLSMTPKQYRQGTRDFAYLVETAGALIKQKYLANLDKYQDRANNFFEDARKLVENSSLPSAYRKDYNAFMALKEDMDPLRLFSYMNTFSNEDVAKKIAIDREGVQALITKMEDFIKEVDRDYVPLKDAINFLASDDKRFKDNRYFIPARKFIIPADTSNLPEGLVSDKNRKYLVDELRFRLSDDVIYKNSIAQLDMLGNNDWKRPIYFSNTVGNEYFLGLDDSFILEGLTYRVAPVVASDSHMFGVADVDKMYKRLVEEFDWGGVDDPRVYLDENSLRMTIKYRYAYALLARALTDKGETDKAVKSLDYCMEHMSNETVPLDFSVIPIIQSYLGAGASEKGLALVEQFENITKEDLDYYVAILGAKPKGVEKMEPDFMQGLRDLKSMGEICMSFGEMDTANRLQQEFDSYVKNYEQFFR